MTTALRLFLFPELVSGTGLFYRRVRAVLGEGAQSIQALGGGISTSSKTAKEKAISEALERLTLDPDARPMTVTTAMTISGTLLHPIKEVGGLRPSSDCCPRWRASACHVDLESAIRAAVTESVERQHLWKWSALCERNYLVNIGQPPSGYVIAPEISSYLGSLPVNVVVSWVSSGTPLPALVVLALRPSQGCFYAASAAGSEWPKVFETALLDIAKVLIVEHHFADNASALNFRRPLAALPEPLRRVASATSLSAWPESVGEYIPSMRAKIVNAPWLTSLSRQMVEIPLDVEGKPPRFLEWFR